VTPVAAVTAVAAAGLRPDGWRSPYADGVTEHLNPTTLPINETESTGRRCKSADQLATRNRGALQAASASVHDGTATGETAAVFCVPLSFRVLAELVIARWLGRFGRATDVYSGRHRSAACRSSRALPAPLRSPGLLAKEPTSPMPPVMTALRARANALT